MSRKDYDPNQPRVPAGKSTGGRWTKDGSGADSSARKAAELKSTRITEMGRLIEKLREDDGFSESISKENPTTGYMCSISTEQVAYPMSTIKESDLENFVADNWNTLLTENYYFGGWVDPIDGVPHGYLDVSENIQDLHEAMVKALKRKQIGIFDLKTFETLYVKDYWDKYNKKRR